MVSHICNYSTWEPEVEGWWALGQPGLYNKNLSQNEKKNICSAILIAQCSKNVQVNMGQKSKEQMLKEREESGGSNSLAIIE